MIAAPKDEPRIAPYLAVIGTVAAATIAVFFGVGVLWLDPLHLGTQPADLAPSAEVPEAHKASVPADNDATRGSSSPPADDIAAIPTSGAPSYREVVASRSMAIDAAVITPPRITPAKRVAVSRHRRATTARRSVAPWRLNAYAGPNPGGGFYGSPNINIGQINPR